MQLMLLNQTSLVIMLVMVQQMHLTQVSLGKKLGKMQQVLIGQISWF
jgi:hypothetical protein